MESQVGQIKQFLKEVYTRRHLFIIVAASVALIAVGASFFVTKRYEAQSTVFIERNVIDSLMKGLTVSPSMDDRIRVLRYYMVSRDMVTRTLKKMDMDADKRYAEPEQFEGLVRQCQEQTNISVRGQDLFFVSITDPDPTFAKNYINTLVNIYVEENLADKRQESYGANRFLTEQVTFYKQKLDEVDAKIIEFRKASGIFSTVNEPTIMAQIARDEETLKELRGQKTQGYSTINTIKQQLKMLRESTSSSYSSPFSGIGSGTDYRIEQLQARIDELLLIYNDQYPTVIKLRDQIEELKKRQGDESATSVMNVEPDNYNPVEDPIYVDLKMRLNVAQSDLNALVAKEQELQASIEANQALLRNFPKDKKTLNDLERERAMQSAVYEQLMQRVGISEVSQQMEVADKSTTFRIVDPAIQPTSPVGIKRSMLKLIGILFGLIAGLGAVFIADHLDNSLRGPQLLRNLGVTVLAEIPFIWSDAEIQVARRKDKAALAFAGVCAVMIGVMLLHDLLGLSLIDQVLANLNINKV
ncbi:MAG: GNVR domain-containing protein [Desulfuromonadales bacterium]|nr:GNVR domain-containing protein [Desulfuromonadales bacterium]